MNMMQGFVQWKQSCCAVKLLLQLQTNNREDRMTGQALPECLHSPKSSDGLKYI